ncbi:MAG: hypothetical protein ACI9KE_002339 [Polyangiales bacterium]|jgi:hypothetical protein
MRIFQKKRVAVVAVALLVLLAPRAEGTAQDGAVLVTEGVGPRAAAGLRRDLSRRWNRPVLALHEAGAANAPHFVSVSVSGGHVYVQYRLGSTIRNERARAGARRSLLLQTVMTAVEGSGLSTGEALATSESDSPRSRSSLAEPRVRPSSPSAMIGTTLLALDVESVLRGSPATTTSMRTDDGILLGLVDESSSSGRVLLATEADQVATRVGRVRAESAGGVLLAIE